MADSLTQEQISELRRLFSSCAGLMVLGYDNKDAEDLLNDKFPAILDAAEEAGILRNAFEAANAIVDHDMDMAWDIIETAFAPEKEA